MKLSTLFLASLLLVQAQTFASGKSKVTLPPVHLLPDADGPAIQAYLKTHQVILNKSNDANITAALSYGERNLNWLKMINATRPNGQQLSMTNPNNRISFPMDKPNKYNPTIIGENFLKLKAEMPKEMSTILFSTQALTAVLPIAEADYLIWARKMDRVYQSAARWQLMEPNLWYYRQRSQNDLRGYYFLNQTQNLDQKLSAWISLSSTEKQQFAAWLLQICGNAGITASLCQTQLNKAISTKKVIAFKNSYMSKAKDLFNSYFRIQGTQDDVKYVNDHEQKLTFMDPLKDTLRHFLKFNLEDEWKWNGWNFRIDFAPSASPRMEFEAGSTPHVNGIAGDIITMDENTPLTEWEVQWVIRHEFGHVLGFPDCYIEFYSESEKAMVNYQLDTTNLMCSRAGNMKQVLYDEMKRVYGRP